MTAHIPLHSKALDDVNAVIGWIYFFAWSLSFYPQTYYNWERKSVVGLNFDYLTYNITGFLGYMVYNVCLFYIPSIQHEYLRRHGAGSTIPVQANDVFFTIHAVALTAITIFQACIYDRGGQRVSTFARTLMVIAWTYIVVTLVLALLGLLALRWVNFLNGLAFIKMGVTIIKYVPQAYMNYSRKSTVGWSIGNVLLDFTGGVFSLLQMVLQYVNDGDVTIFIGDPVKLGLALFSIGFDILFMFQHYVFYPRSKDAKAAADHARIEKIRHHEPLTPSDRGVEDGATVPLLHGSAADGATVQ